MSGTDSNVKGPTELGKEGWWETLKRAKQRMKALDLAQQASAVAFWAMMSIFPSLIALVMIYGLVSEPQDVTQQIEDALKNVSEETRTVVGDQVISIASSRSGALSLGLIISLALLLWAASSGMSTFMKAVTTAYEQEETRGFVKLRVIALALVFVALVVSGILVAVIGIVPPVLENVLDSPSLRWLLFGVEGLLLLAILIGTISLAYRFAPADPPPGWRWITPGAIVAGVALVLFTLVFTFYVNNFGSYNKTYGALAGVIILMLWLYYSAYVVLLGALVNAVGARVASEGSPAASSGPSQGQSSERSSRTATAKMH